MRNCKHLYNRRFKGNFEPLNIFPDFWHSVGPAFIRGVKVVTTVSKCHSSLLAHPLQWRHNERDGVSNYQSIVCSTVCSGADQRKHQSSASLAPVRGIHQSPVDSPHKRAVMRKMFPMQFHWHILFMMNSDIQKQCNNSESYGALWRLTTTRLWQGTASQTDMYHHGATATMCVKFQNNPTTFSAMVA